MYCNDTDAVLLLLQKVTENFADDNFLRCFMSFAVLNSWNVT